MQLIKVGELCSIRTGKLDANKGCEDGQYPFFTCSQRPLKIDTFSYDCECVLIAGNGDLNVKYYSGKFDAYQRTYILESIDKNHLSTKYLYYFFSKYINILRNNSIGGVIKYIKLGDLQDAVIPLPNLKYQNKIVNILDQAQELIDKRKAQIDALDELIQSVFYDMFGDLRINSSRFRIEKFQDIVTNRDSMRIPLKQSDRDGREGMYPYYGATGIIDYIDDFIFSGDYLLIAEDGKNLETKNKDIAFIARGDFWVNNHAHVTEVKDFMNLYYLKYYINSIDLTPFITGIDQLKLNRGNLYRIKVIVGLSTLN